jgi:hypothetical protein
MYLILGIVAIAIPFLNTLSGFMGAKGVGHLSISSQKLATCAATSSAIRIV